MSDEVDDAKKPPVDIKTRVVVPLTERIARGLEERERNPPPEAVPSPSPTALSAVDPALPGQELVTDADVRRALTKTETTQKYRPEYAEQVKVLIAYGATNAELADWFECSISTLQRWGVWFPEFGAALRDGRDAFTARVVRSLAQRAVGYTFDTVKIFVTKDGKVVEVPYREHVPPDVTACIFWLKNRDPENWRDVNHHQHSGNITVTVSAEEEKW